MAQRSFISNLIFTLALNILVKPLWVLLIDRQVQIQAGHTQYGLYSALLSMALIFNILLDIGLTNYNQRTMAAYPETIRTDWPNMMLSKALLGILFTGFILGVGYILGYREQALTWLLWIAVIQLLNPLLLFLRSCISAQHDFRMDAVLSVLDKLLVIVLCAYWLYAPEQPVFALEKFLYAQAGGYLLAVLIALAWIIKQYGPFSKHHLALHTIGNILKSSIPYAVLILFMAVYMRVDAMMLERMHGPEQAGYYAATYRLLDMSNTVGYLMAGILLPLFSRMLREKKDISTILIQSTNMLFGMALTAMVFVWFYSGGIMDWLYPADTGHLDRLFQLTFSMFPAFCMMYLFATVLTARGEIMLLLKLAGGGALVALFANALLIHYYKAQGAAIASLIVEWGMAFAYLFFARKHVPWIWPAFWWLKCATLILSMAILNYVFCRLHITWFLAALLNIPCFLAIVYSIRFWQKEAIASYLREFRANRMGD